MMKRISNFIASKIALRLSIEKQKEEIIAYGAFSLLLTLTSIILYIVFGIAFDVFVEILLISFSASILRKYSGGAHATSPGRCQIIGLLIFGGFALLLHNLVYLISIFHSVILIIVAFVFAYYIVNKFAPVDTPNKPIVKEEKKKRLKKRSMITLHVYFIITLIGFYLFFNTGNDLYLKVVISIGIGNIWQTFTLTPQGHFIINKADALLKYLSRLLRGEVKEYGKKTID